MFSYALKNFERYSAYADFILGSLRSPCGDALPASTYVDIIRKAKQSKAKESKAKERKAKERKQQFIREQVEEWSSRDKY